MNYKLIKNLIAQGETSQAILTLIKAVENSEVPEKSDVLLLSARFNSLLKDSRRGILAGEEVTKNTNQIISHLLSFVNELETVYPNGFEAFRVFELESPKTNIEVCEKIKQFNKKNHQYISSFNQQYLIEDIFISPTITENNNTKSEVDILDILKLSGQKIIIHSDSFTGKSTLLKYICNSIEKPIFYIPLSKYNGNIFTLISEAYGINKHTISKFIDTNIDCWVLFDAFDEIQTTELQIEFIDELNAFSRFLMTSRTYSLRDFTLPSTKILTIQPYSTENIYLLVDKRVNDFGNILNFYNSIKNSSRTQSDFLLKFPWLVIFLIEHFEAGNFSAELIDDLPFEILTGLEKKLRVSKTSDEKIKKFIIETGNLLFNRLMCGNLNIREIHKDEISEENIEIFKNLTSFGLISTTSHLSSVFSISIPLLPELLMAHYLCNRSKSELIKLLSLVYCRTEYKEIIILSAKIWVSKGNDIKDFDPTKHQFACNGYPSANNYENLLYYLTLRNIPSYLCYKFDDIIAGYFERIKNIFDERDDDYQDEIYELSPQQLSLREVREAFEEKIIDFLSFFNRKTEKHTNDFYKFIKKINRNDMDPGLGIALNKNYKYIINCNDFTKDLMQKIQNSKHEDVYIYLTYLINSPVYHPDIYKLLLSEISSTKILGNSTDELLWEDNLWISETMLLLLLKANLTDKEVLFILDLLSKFKFYQYDEEYAKNKLGTIKSIVLTNRVLEYIASKLEKGVQIGSVKSVIYLLQDMFLFNKNSKKTETLLNKIIILCHQYFKSVESENFKTSAHWDNIEFVYCQILKLFPLKGLEESTYEFLETTYYYDKPKGQHKKKVSTLLYYLINMESLSVLNFIERNDCSLILSNNRFITHPILVGQFKFSEKYINDIRKIISNNTNELYDYKDSIIGFIDNDLGDICRIMPIDNFNEKAISAEELMEKCKLPDFHQFLEDNPEIKYFKYALMYGIFNEKPIFAKQIGDNQIKYFYSCSEVI